MNGTEKRPEGRLGILAGKGQLPWIGARAAIRAGEDVRAFCFTTEAPPDDLLQICRQVKLLRIFTSVIKAMKKEGVTRLMLLGKSNREVLYKNSILDFDWRVLWLLARSRNQNDYSIFEVISKEFEKRGIQIISQETYLKELFLPVGRYGKKLNGRELEDVFYGMGYAREINRLDIGQTVVVGKKAVLAVECAEGTDNCIRRGGELFNKKGAVVCKTAKVDHDDRFDIPVTGLETLESLKDSGCRVLAIEARKTFVVEPAQFLAKADAYGITVVALAPEETDLKNLKSINARSATLKKVN